MIVYFGNKFEVQKSAGMPSFWKGSGLKDTIRYLDCLKAATALHTDMLVVAVRGT